MEFSKDQIEELKQVSPDFSFTTEGGYTYFLLPKYVLPYGCLPKQLDLLLCPMPKNSYNSILYFAEKPTGCIARNWNGTAYVLDRSWFSLSWKTGPGHTLLQMLKIHLNALKHETQ